LEFLVIMIFIIQQLMIIQENIVLDFGVMILLEIQILVFQNQINFTLNQAAAAAEEEVSGDYAPGSSTAETYTNTYIVTENQF